MKNPLRSQPRKAVDVQALSKPNRAAKCQRATPPTCKAALDLKVSHPITASQAQRNAPYDVMVIGAGPAGLMAALRAAQCGCRRLLLIEAGPLPGRKLLLTGGGRANYSRREPLEALLPHYPGGGKFLYGCFSRWGSEAVEEAFEAMGVSPVVEGHQLFAKGGSRHLLKALLKTLDRLNVPILLNTKVQNLQPQRGGWLVQTPQGRLQAKQVILACGGWSFPETGSDGQLQATLPDLGIPLVEPTPAMVPLHVAEKAFCATLSGVTLDGVRLSNPDHVETGSLVFTHKGLSGPAVLNLSRHVLRGDRQLICDFAASFNPLRNARKKGAQWGREAIGAEASSLKSRLMKPYQALLESPMAKRRLLDYAEDRPERLRRALLEHAGLSANQRFSTLGLEGYIRLFRRYHAFEFHVVGSPPLARAYVTAGGVSLQAIDPKTLRSKVHPRLLVCGEMLDLDGACGGYNLLAAWSTGHRAGEVAALNEGLDGSS